MANTYRHTADFDPYFDDWESAKHDDKGYVKVLFKPSRAVQARELNQSQTYLNSQIASLGGYLFKDGTPVSGAKISYVTNQKYAIATIRYNANAYDFDEVKDAILSSNKITDSSSSLNDYTMTGTLYNTSSSSISNSAQAITVSENSGNSTDTTGNISDSFPVIQITGIYEYENPVDSQDESSIASLTTTSNGVTSKKVIVLYNLYGGIFEEGSYLFVSNIGNFDIIFENVIDIDSTDTTSSTISSKIYKTCTVASCSKGIIFVDGYFINVPMASVIVNPFKKLDSDNPVTSFGLQSIDDNNIQYNVGFWIERSIVTAYEDTTLTDPASGSYNYKAPGADRYKIIGNLCSITDEKLSVELENSKNITSTVDTPIKFVTGIVLKNNVLIKEQNNVGTNSDLMDELARRTYEESGSYAVNPWKVQIEESSNDSSEYIVSIGPGLGYVYGYRVSNVVSQKISNEKSRQTIIKRNNSKYTDSSRYTVTDDIYTADKDAGKNLKSYHLDKIINAEKCFLVNRHISEALKQYNTDGSYNSYTNPSEFCTTALYNSETKKITYDGTEIGTVLGAVSISSINIQSYGNLMLYVNTIDSSSYASAFSIISVDFNSSDSTNLKVTGYVDLYIDSTTNTSEWNNTESPYIFETDYSYVSNDVNSFSKFELSYNTVVYAKTNSNNSINTETGKVILDSGSGLVPDTQNDIICVMDNNGNVFSPNSYSIDNSSGNTFALKFLRPDDLLLSESIMTYFIEPFVYNSSSITNSAVMKQKTLKIATETIEVASNRDDTTTTEAIIEKLNEITLENYDLVTVLSIKIDEVERLYENDESVTLSSMEDYINLDTGATDYCYKESKIYGIGDYLKAITVSASTSGDNVTDILPEKITITYAYFEHSPKLSNGFYCAYSYNIFDKLIGSNNATDKTTIDSTTLNDANYTDINKKRLYNYFGVSGFYKSDSEYVNSGVSADSYKLIPIYKSSSGSQYNLANCIDFRPDYSETEKRNILFSNVPLPLSEVKYTISLYLPRIDSVWVDKSGNFGITQGIAAEMPYPPAEADGSMTLYHLYNRPYGISINDIIPTYIENKRHTMKDISKLSDRVTALEEVVSISLIEQSAINMQITDDDGITRYKCGIFTDTFSNFNNCNINHSEWKASIDSVEKSIHPCFAVSDFSISPVGKYWTKDVSDITEQYKLVPTSENQMCSFLYPINANETTEPLTGVICWNNSIITLMPKDMSKSELRDIVLKYNDNAESSPIEWIYPSKFSYIYAKNINCTESTNVQSLMFATWDGNLNLFPAIDTWVNDLGDVVATTTYEETEQPAEKYRTWTTTSTSSFDTTEVKTVESGLSVNDIRKLYGSDKAATEAGKLHQRVVSSGTKVANGGNGVGHWEPAETTTTVRSYETTTTTTTTETTTYTGSYIATDSVTYMEQQDAFMRVRFVEFTIKGMRPLSNIYATMDGVNIKILSNDISTSNLSPETINEMSNEIYSFVTTDESGCASGHIVIPDKMPVGTKVVKFFDSENLATCYADYTANGKTVWNNIDRTYIRQWNPVTTQTTQISTSEPVFTGSTRTITATEVFKEEDPIAESFYISEENGIMLEAIDIFFASKDPSIGVELFIVECENGYPGQTIVPFSRVFVENKDVKITTEETIEKQSIKSLPAPTTFRFPVPIYLHPKQEYAFIVIAPSLNYTIYTSTIGKLDLVSGQEIKTQPYLGSMFKSQNLRTWTAEQESDIMFVMYSMKFEITSSDNPSKVYFSLDDMISRRTLGYTMLPEGNNADNPKYDMMNLSAGIYTPNMSNIEFLHNQNIDTNVTSNGWVKYNNKQDIFLDKEINLYNNINFSNNNNEDKFINSSSSLYIMANLSTGDENVTPQLDIEDFHGIFSRNIISTKTTTLNGYQYYKAGTYVSNSIVLKEPALGLKVIVDAILPGESKIKGYYMLSNASKKYYTLTPNSTLMNNTVIVNNDIVDSSSNAESSVINAISTKITSQIGLGSRNIDEIMNKMCNVWYHVYDTGDCRYKFIAPSQIVYSNSTTHVLSTFIPTTSGIIVTETDNNANTYDATKIIINKASDPEAFKTISITDNEDDNVLFSYETNSSTNEYTIIGIYAIPQNSSMHSPENVINPHSIKGSVMDTLIMNEYGEYVTNNADDSITYQETYSTCNFKTILCSDYDPTYTYMSGEMCISDGVLFINNGSTSIKNIRPTLGITNENEQGWKEIPCLLLTKSYSEQTINESEDLWIDLQCNDYKITTERQTNFMEYTYSSTESYDISESFDEFIIKFELYSKNQCEVPRFRNLRAIAVV